MYYIQRGDDDPDRQVQDDDDEEVLDFVFDGTIRYASSYASEGRSQIKVLRELVEAALAGAGDPVALGSAVQSLMARVDKAIVHFQQCGQKKPELGEFCARNVAAYQAAHEALAYLANWLSDPRSDYLTNGMLALERAVADVDALVSEESGGG
jgi:hypothetical protein